MYRWFGPKPPVHIIKSISDENNKFKVSVILILSSGIVKWEFTDTPLNESLLLIQLALVLIVLPDKSSFPIVNIDTLIQ